MESVSHHVHDVGENPQMVLRVKRIHNVTIFVDVGEDFLEQIEPQVSVCAQLVPQRPYDAVQNYVKAIFFEGIEHSEVVFDQGLEESEKVRPNLGERVKVSGDQRKTGPEDHVQQVGQKIRRQHKPQLLQNNSEESHKLLLFGLGHAGLKILEQIP